MALEKWRDCDKEKRAYFILLLRLILQEKVCNKSSF